MSDIPLAVGRLGLLARARIRCQSLLCSLVPPFPSAYRHLLQLHSFHPWRTSRDGCLVPVRCVVSPARVAEDLPLQNSGDLAGWPEASCLTRAWWMCDASCSSGPAGLGHLCHILGNSESASLPLPVPLPAAPTPRVLISLLQWRVRRPLVATLNSQRPRACMCPLSQSRPLPCLAHVLCVGLLEVFPPQEAAHPSAWQQGPWQR